MLLHVKIKPNQCLDKVEKQDGNWVIRLKAPAIDGKANEHLIGYLSAVLDLPKSAIVLKKGQTARFKTLEINSSDDYVITRLEQALAG